MTVVLTDPRVLASKLVETFNTHNENALKALIAPQAKLTAPGDIRVDGRDSVIGYFSIWLKGFPDARLTIRHEIVSGPWVVQEYTFEGLHTASLNGTMGEIKATNRKVNGKGVQLVKFENDLVVECRIYFDMVEVLTQLGIMPIAVKN